MVSVRTLAKWPNGFGAMGFSRALRDFSSPREQYDPGQSLTCRSVETALEDFVVDHALVLDRADVITGMTVL
jgi:hypothetical protein